MNRTLTLVALAAAVSAGWPAPVSAQQAYPSRPIRIISPFAPGGGNDTLCRTIAPKLTYVSAGIGASGHLGGALFEVLTGTKMLHVPYKGMALALTDLISGQVTMTFGTSLSVVPHVRSGRLRALATTGAQRSPALPDLPTVAETVPGYEASLWYGFVGPAHMPPQIVRKLNAEIVGVLKLPDVRERLAGQGVDVHSSTPEEFAKLLSSDMERWAKLVRRAGIKAE